MAEEDSARPLVAAGGLLWRRAGEGSELAIVFRGRHGDWTLPKGKPNDGETLAETALREVREETGVTARRELLAGAIRYQVEGRAKSVFFWHMHATDAPPEPLAEDVSEVAWVTPEVALERLTHAGERRLVQSAASTEPRAPTPKRGLRRWRWPEAPERTRLVSDIQVARSQLSGTLAASVLPGEWAAESAALLDLAEHEARQGDLDSGWKYLHEARRQELGGLELESLAAARVALTREAEDKLPSWRKAAVLELLGALGEPGANPPVSVDRWRAVIDEAMRARDGHTDNVYFRNRLLRRQMAVIGATLAVVVVAFLLLLGFAPKLGEGLEKGDLQVWPVLVAMALGAMGACLSALITFATSTTELRIPSHLANVSITATRPLIGAVSGAVALLMLKGGIVVIAGNATPWVAPFLFGFSERFVVGALSRSAKA